jgi:predicted DNA-binding antitoxin AbrB/MazE fold protein
MRKTVEAIYENGLLRLLEPLEGLSEPCKVRVTIETVEPSVHPLANCVGILPDEDASEMRRIIEEEFERAKMDTSGQKQQCHGME